MCWPGPHQHNCEERSKNVRKGLDIVYPSSDKLQCAIYYAIDGDQVTMIDAELARGSIIVTRLGDFWKLFTTNLLRYKSSQKRLVTFWGHFEKSFLYFSKLRDYFLGNFRNIWANFYSNIWSH